MSNNSSVASVSRLDSYTRDGSTMMIQVEKNPRLQMFSKSAAGSNKLKNTEMFDKY